MRLIVIGGGISGLSAAYYATKYLPQAHISVIEADSRWGGKITTERVSLGESRFIIEGGPDTFLAVKPWGVGLCQELGLDDRLFGTNPEKKNTYVLSKGRLLPLPDGLAMMIPADIPSVLRSQLLTWQGKMRMGLDFFLPRHSPNGDETLGAFVSRRLGRQAYENLIEPLMSGIYAGDGDKLSLLSTFPYLRDMELKYGSLARGALVARKTGRGKSLQGSRSAFLTPLTGLAEIVERLVERLRSHHVEMRLNTRAKALHRTSLNMWELSLDTGETLTADGLIVATPAVDSAALFASFDPDLAVTLQKIPYVTTATVSLAYHERDIPRDLDGYGYVIPRREGRRALACTWTSTKFPHRAPQNYALLRVFIGRAGQEIPWDEGELARLAREELKLTLGVISEPLLERVYLWHHAMPQYNLGHLEILQNLDTALGQYAGLALAGNGYRGIGIPDCIHSGELAVKKILENMQVENSWPLSM